MKFNFQIINYKNKIIYLYDAVINNIVEISSNELKAIYHLQNSSYTTDDLKELTRLFSMGFLQPTIPYKIEHPLTAYIHSIVDQYTSNMVLQITQNCNFSCRYCSYANNYGPIRNHSETYMSYKTARKAILFLKEKSVFCKNINIHFYGGEPLLNYSVIKDCILYSKEIFEDKNIQFEIITNLSVLDNDMLHFFIKHNIFLTVSLDGPKSVHDKYRRYAHNGKGSFDNVYDNLKLIYSTNKCYYSNNVSINAVIEPAADLKEIQLFFTEDILLKNNRITYNHMENENNDAYFSQSTDHRVKLNSSYLNYLLCNLIDANNNIAFFSDFENINNLSFALDNTDIGAKETVWHHNGPCIAGYRKLFVNVIGEFFPCEKVNELNPEMNIGNINSGYNYENIEKQLNIAKITHEECKICWAKHLCFLCQKMVDDSNILSKRKKLLHCTAQKKNILFDLKIKCLLDKLKEFV